MDIGTNAINAVSAQQVESASNTHIELPTVEQWRTDQQDVNSFENALNSAQQANSPDKITDAHNGGNSMADDVLSKMQSLSTHAAEKGQALEQLINKASHSLNPMDIVKANRMMSEYYLENMMTAKLVGNASKAIERLTSLN